MLRAVGRDRRAGGAPVKGGRGPGITDIGAAKPFRRLGSRRADSPAEAGRRVPPGIGLSCAGGRGMSTARAGCRPQGWGRDQAGGRRAGLPRFLFRSFVLARRAGGAAAIEGRCTGAARKKSWPSCGGWAGLFPCPILFFAGMGATPGPALGARPKSGAAPSISGCAGPSAAPARVRDGAFFLSGPGSEGVGRIFFWGPVGGDIPRAICGRPRGGGRRRRAKGLRHLWAGGCAALPKNGAGLGGRGSNMQNITGIARFGARRKPPGARPGTSLGGARHRPPPAALGHLPKHSTGGRGERDAPARNDISRQGGGRRGGPEIRRPSIAGPAARTFL